MSAPAEALPRLHNPNLTDDEVRLIALLLDCHKAKVEGDLMYLLETARALIKTLERMPEGVFETLAAKFDKLWDIVGCNCDDPECVNRRS